MTTKLEMDIIELLKSKSQKDAALMYNVSQSQISGILKKNGIKLKKVE